MNCPACGQTIAKKASKQERGYYHAVVLKWFVALDFGYSKEDWHYELRKKFLYDIKVVLGKERRIPRSTTTLTTVEMEKYLQDCRDFYFSFTESMNIPPQLKHIPLPNEQPLK